MKSDYIEKLITTLQEYPLVSVRFRTKVGTERVMECTQMLLYVPTELQDGRFDFRLNGPDIICVFDYQNSGYRAFRKDSVLSYEILSWNENE